MLDSNVHARLAALLPPSALLTAPEDTRPYECDGPHDLSHVARGGGDSGHESQVVEVLKQCHALRVPVVARGAGTSLSGGAMPDKNGVVLSLAKFTKIVAIDPLARTAVVQPGVRNRGNQ
jgi:glycolate oxidase